MGAIVGTVSTSKEIEEKSSKTLMLNSSMAFYAGFATYDAGKPGGSDWAYNLPAHLGHSGNGIFNYTRKKLETRSTLWFKCKAKMYADTIPSLRQPVLSLTEPLGS
jgi:hypothetical protein